MKLSIRNLIRVIAGAFALVAIVFLFGARIVLSQFFIIAMLLFAISMILGFIKPRKDIEEDDI